MEEKNGIVGRQADRQLGLCVLRMLMCFGVILCHFWSDDSYSKVLTPFIRLREYAVLVFMFMSFMLTQKAFVSNDLDYMGKRLWRLIVPHVGWAFLYWAIYGMVEICFNVDLIGGISDLVCQIFTGHSPRLNATMWYQVVLIVISVVFFIIFKLLPVKKGIFCTYIFLAAALLMQYTGLNYTLFSDLRYELKYPLGRVCEMVPCAVAGFNFAYCGLTDKLKKHRVIVILGSIVISSLLIANDSKLSYVKGFGYSGIPMICAASLLVITAVLLPLDNLPEKIKKAALTISKYTLGIYCMHRMVGRLIGFVFEKMGVKAYTFLMCVVIYILCYFISFIIANIPGKLCRQLVE